MNRVQFILLYLCLVYVVHLIINRLSLPNFKTIAHNYYLRLMLFSILMYLQIEFYNKAAVSISVDMKITMFFLILGALSARFGVYFLGLGE